MRRSVVIAAGAVGGLMAGAGLYGGWRVYGPGGLAYRPSNQPGYVAAGSTAAGRSTGPSVAAAPSPPTASAPGSPNAVPMRSTLNGVYTEDQAKRGYDVYAGMCRSCHAGLGNHSGPVFRAHWGGKPLSELFNYMVDQMPKDNPGSLSYDDYTIVIAYLLKLNGMPAGSKELPADYDALARIRLDTGAVKGQ